MASAAPDHPVRLLADRLGCAAVAPLAVKDRRQTWRVRRADTDLVLKCWSGDRDATPYPIVAHRLLAAIDGLPTRLALPRYLYDGHDEDAGHYVMMTCLPGTGYEGRWHYTKAGIAGGAALDGADIDLALDLLDDLGQALLPPLLEAGLQVRTWPATVLQAIRRLHEIVRQGVMPPDLAAAAHRVIAGWDGPAVTAPLRFSNTDFRHLNFIRMPSGGSGSQPSSTRSCAATAPNAPAQAR